MEAGGCRSSIRHDLAEDIEEDLAVDGERQEGVERRTIWPRNDEQTIQQVKKAEVTLAEDPL